MIYHVVGLEFMLSEGYYPLAFGNGYFNNYPGADGNQWIRMVAAGSGKTYEHQNKYISDEEGRPIPPVLKIPFGTVNIFYITGPPGMIMRPVKSRLLEAVKDVLKRHPPINVFGKISWYSRISEFFKGGMDPTRAQREIIESAIGCEVRKFRY